MKPTKHIKQLALSLAQESLKEHLEFYKRVIPEAFDQENKPEAKQLYLYRENKAFLSQLMDIKKALYKGSFYIRVDRVSSSGMSRRLNMAYVKNNKIVTIHCKHIKKLAGQNKFGRISGCGMDMLFHSQYNLFVNLHKSYKKAHYQKNMKQYLNY
tara:strand:- start:1107 stop:1571 length:465 start_codon:yes stop_codon:yes gene_type:complete